MHKLILLLAGCWLIACSNNQSGNAAKRADSATQVSDTTNALAKEAELSFMDGCVENAKARLGEENAYVYCKCIFAQIKTKFGTVDSTVIAGLEKDTAQVAKMAANCK